MISNLRTDLKKMGIEEREEEILEEAERVRIELGYPILVSPFAQFVVTQAMLNVMSGERYRSIPDEVRRYVLGHYGTTADLPGRWPRRWRTECSAWTEHPQSRSPVGPARRSLRPYLGCARSEGPSMTTTTCFWRPSTPTPTLLAAWMRNAQRSFWDALPLSQMLEGLSETRAGGDVQVTRPGVRVRVRH
jgi:hypothetical protein